LRASGEFTSTVKPDKGGVAFVRGMVQRLKAIGYVGAVLVIDSGDGVKAPHDLKVKTGDSFAAAFKARVEAARPAADVVRELPAAKDTTAKAATASRRKNRKEAP